MIENLGTGHRETTIISFSWPRRIGEVLESRERVACSIMGAIMLTNPKFVLDSSAVLEVQPSLLFSPVHRLHPLDASTVEQRSLANFAARGLIQEVAAARQLNEPISADHLAGVLDALRTDYRNDFEVEGVYANPSHVLAALERLCLIHYVSNPDRTFTPGEADTANSGDNYLDAFLARDLLFRMTSLPVSRPDWGQQSGGENDYREQRAA